MWYGWTTLNNASAYESYLQTELFPRLQRELASNGYLGFQVLRSKKPSEVEFVTMLWFKSLSSVQAFAGENYSTPVISEKAKSLLWRYADRVEHYEVSGSSLPEFQ
jgi:heme-degrading monooxygenase HmoA